MVTETEPTPDVGSHTGSASHRHGLIGAILDIAVYMFVNAMTTVSAVIFLYGATTKLAAISIVHMDEAGATAAAAAMATLIVATALGVKLLHVGVSRLLFVRMQAWRKR